MDENKFWDKHPSWQAAEAAWEKNSARSKENNPLKVLSHLPNMPGITEETAVNLKWKSLKYLFTHDKTNLFWRYFLKSPFKYPFSLIRSLWKKKSYKRDGDFFFYGINSMEEFKQILTNPKHLLIVGFSYCHKPHECPSQRFTPDCIHDPNHPVCQQCFIGKAIHALPKDGVVVLIIPTIHDLGEELLKLLNQHPDRELTFLITACELTLEMFSDWGNMINLKGVGVRLDGRICNTMRAFELSEHGVKPGLTVVLEPAQKQILELIHFLRSQRNGTTSEKV